MRAWLARRSIFNVESEGYGRFRKFIESVVTTAEYTYTYSLEITVYLHTFSIYGMQSMIRLL